MSNPASIAAVVVTFGLVIFIHELGHFIVCRLLGIRVERFAFGFGPELAGMTTSSGTRLSFCAFPLGGYVKPAGENLEEATGAPEEYFSKPWYGRLGVVFAGPAMNYVLAFVLFFSIAMVWGVRVPLDEPVVGGLAAGFPAEAAGLKPDDRVLKVGREPVSTWAQMAGRIHKLAGLEVALTVQRGDELKTVRVVPRRDSATGRGLIGISQKVVRRPAWVLGSAREGARQCWFWTAYTVTTLAEKIWQGKRPDLAGPVGIIQMVHQAARSGFEDLVTLVALISVAVGFFNLLPIPLLDGGHAVLYLWEGASRRRLTLKAVAVANSVGMVLLMSLLLFATYSDLARIKEGRRERKAAAEQARQAGRDGAPPDAPAPVPLSPGRKKAPGRKRP